MVPGAGGWGRGMESYCLLSTRFGIRKKKKVLEMDGGGGYTAARISLDVDGVEGVMGTWCVCYVHLSSCLCLKISVIKTENLERTLEKSKSQKQVDFRIRQTWV